MAKPLLLRSRSKPDPTVADVTVVIPVRRNLDAKQTAWLEQAKASLPEGVRITVAPNDNDMVGACNRSVMEAETDWVFPMGADDLLAEGCLEFLLSYTDGKDVVYPSQILTSEDLTETVGLNVAQPFCPHRIQTLNYVSGAALIRREAWLEAGGYRDLETLEDWDLWLRMSRAGKRFQHVPEARYVWRQVPKSRSKGAINFDEFRRIVVPEPTDVKAAFIHQATDATTYLRCQLPARYLPGQLWAFNHFPLMSSKESNILEFPDIPENVVMQFPGDAGRLVALWGLQETGRKVFVEVDDTYLVKGPIQSTHWAEAPTEENNSYMAHRKIVGESDGVITTTEHLAKQYLRAGAKRAWVCPNMVDPSDWPESPWEQDDVFRIGWFASRSHVHDGKLIKRALEWAGRQDGVEVYVMGVEPPGWQVKKRRKGNVAYTQLPWSNDLRTYYKMLQMLDVGLCPVVETEWSACRSDIKPVELGMAGALPVVSDAMPYVGWSDMDACRKAKTSGDFLRAVQWCVQNQDEVKDLAKATREYVLAERDIRSSVSCWEEVFDG